MVFRSKMDVWLVALHGCVSALLLWSSWHMYVTKPPPLSLLGFLPLAMASSIIWRLFRTRYVVTSDEVIVHSGLFARHIPFKSIVQVTPTRSVLYGPALSLDRLAIHYNTNLVRTVCRVSPSDKEAFLQAIRALESRAA
jgi:hypothetical protein